MINFDQLESAIADQPIKRIGDDKFITAHYYVVAAYDIREAAERVAYYQSTAASIYHDDTLLGRCSGKVSGVEYVRGKNEGLISVSFPVEMFGDKIYSGDILHIVSGAVQNDEAKHRVFYLRDVEIPPAILATFPGPRYGSSLLAKSQDPVVGTIIKPCSGLTLGEYEAILNDLVSHDAISFIKEDENLMPGFRHCPLPQRVQIAAKVIARAGRRIIYAPHITANPRQFFNNINVVAEAGLPAVMFSETYYGGLLRDARDFIEENNLDLAIYAHNGGISVKTKSINRVLLDHFCRLDGADWRQTAPSAKKPFLRPLSWQRELIEDVLTRDALPFPATICVRAGGLDQGNLLQNIHECSGRFDQYIFLMGSAINSIVNDRGEVDTNIAMSAIDDLVDLYRQGIDIREIAALHDYSVEHNLDSVARCLRQRYKDEKLRAPRVVA